MVGACDCYSNKIRVAHKGKNEDQIAWCNALKALLQGLVAYIKDHHMSGVAYNNAKGGDLSAASGAAAPPPPPAAAAKAAPARPNPMGGGGAGGLMAELAKKKSGEGDSAATGLKTVTKDMQTWREDYKGGDKPAQPVKAKVAPRAPPKSIVTGPPVCEVRAR